MHPDLPTLLLGCALLASALDALGAPGRYCASTLRHADEPDDILRRVRETRAAAWALRALADGTPGLRHLVPPTTAILDGCEVAEAWAIDVLYPWARAA
jgi:hypothetical protein